MKSLANICLIFTSAHCFALNNLRTESSVNNHYQTNNSSDFIGNNSGIVSYDNATDQNPTTTVSDFDYSIDTEND